MDFIFRRAVVDQYVEASRHRDEHLLQMLMGVTGSRCATGNIVEIINALYIEGHMASRFDKSEVAARIGYAGQLDQAAILDAHKQSCDVAVFGGLIRFGAKYIQAVLVATTPILASNSFGSCDPISFIAARSSGE